MVDDAPGAAQSDPRLQPHVIPTLRSPGGATRQQSGSGSHQGLGGMPPPMLVGGVGAELAHQRLGA